MEKSRVEQLYRFATLGLMALIFLPLATGYANWIRGLDDINLIIHEMGHYVVFQWFGVFIMTLGGTLNQLLVPSVFGLMMWNRDRYLDLAICLFWIGENLVNISYYMADATALKLSLFPPGATGHDWNYLLSSVGLLWADRFLSWLTFFLGVTVMGGVIFQIVRFPDKYRNIGEWK